MAQAAQIFGQPLDDRPHAGSSSSGRAADRGGLSFVAWLEGRWSGAVRAGSRAHLQAYRRTPSLLDKPMACWDKIVLLAGALLSSTLFAVHHMVASPWDLLYVVAGCMILPVTFFVILRRKAVAQRRRPDDAYKVHRKWARMTFGMDFSMPQELRHFRIAGTKCGGKARLEQLEPVGVQCLPSYSDSCVCCLVDFKASDTLAVLPCGHVFCEACICSWSFCGRAASRHCPICRTDFRVRRGTIIESNV
mmetsp:Transcript_17499/g.30416  ORF Transcript_17499/g.30416 Transcript_17499/m.30416 type:complete len:248 (+) Transcript_17499:50-793(+)